MKNYGSILEEKKTSESAALLDDSITVTDASGQIGEATLSQLQEQRSTLEAASQHAVGARGLTQQARQEMRNIEFRVVKEKLVLGFVILLLLGVDGASRPISSD
mmetsp:Transcript_6600/g.27724  ORF Transcript_6600/g.27724 Transcript_6600/m.27724 type:complete len:104 (+) Transcript_6600:104-415(+)